MNVPPVRLLFVDDESTIRCTLSAILNNKGFDVTTAASVPESLKLINTEHFEVLLSDLNIGEPGDGFTIVSAMRRVQPWAATFILTGYPDFESALLAIRNQVDDYFTKPADIDSLVESITQRLTANGSANPQAPLRYVSAVLRDNVPTITREWLSSVRQDTDLARLQISDEDRIDHIPGILEELIRRLESNLEETSPSAAVVCAQHGRARGRQGYSAPEIVREARILQHVLASTIQANLLGLNLSRLIPDMVNIGESLASMLELSIRAYQEECINSTAGVTPFSVA